MNADQEQKFIGSLGLASCTAGPLNLVNTALVQVSLSTKTVDSIGTTLQLLAASRTLAPVSLRNFLVPQFRSCLDAVSYYLNETVEIKSMVGNIQIFLFAPYFSFKL